MASALPQTSAAAASHLVDASPIHATQARRRSSPARAARSSFRTRKRASPSSGVRRSLGTRSERGVGMRTASAFTRWKRVCRGLKPQPTRVVLSAQRVLRVTAGEAADAGKCEVRAASALVAACERAARGPLRRPFPAPARGRGRGEGGAALGAAPRRVVGNGVAFERCGGAGVPGLRPRSSGRRLAAATTRRRRKSWCLRLERAHDHPTRFHRASALQELRRITSVSAGRPLFIPFLRIALDTPETARFSIHGACVRWRDPDSNRGHHDFQSCGLGWPKARNPWKPSGSPPTHVPRRRPLFTSFCTQFRRWRSLISFVADTSNGVAAGPS